MDYILFYCILYYLFFPGNKLVDAIFIIRDHSKCIFYVGLTYLFVVVLSFKYLQASK